MPATRGQAGAAGAAGAPARARTEACTTAVKIPVFQNARVVIGGLRLYACGAASSVARCRTGRSNSANAPIGSDVKKAL